jgi:transposase-like protein
LTRPDGLLKQFTKTVLETALNEEMTDHIQLGCSVPSRHPDWRSGHGPVIG